MDDHPFVLVSFDPDWEALYVRGKKVAEGHHVEIKRIVLEAQSLALNVGKHVPLEGTYVEGSDGNEHEEYEIHDKLEDFSETILGRIG